jgi:hypothetical protein
VRPAHVLAKEGRVVLLGAVEVGGALFSWVSRGLATIEFTIRRASTTVSIAAARMIRASRLCRYGALTYSVRSSSRVGSLGSIPTIASISSKRSSDCASRPPQ